MGMSFFLASWSSPMSALRSTPPEDSTTMAGRAARKALMPPSISSVKGPALHEGEVTGLSRRRSDGKQSLQPRFQQAAMSTSATVPSVSVP